MTDPNQGITVEHVPDFSAQGFAPAAGVAAAAAPEGVSAAAAAQLTNVHALALSACVSASYNPTTNKICFNFPIVGNICITSPIPIPVGAQLKVCGQTCGSFIPHGLKVTVYLNNNPVFTKVVWGTCP
jgi:hypothetical protein